MMDTRISRRMHADPDLVFKLAAAVEDWPRMLPHYRWVRVLAGEGQPRRLVEMAARRDVVGRLGIPLRWSAIQVSSPQHRRIEFEHVRGITRGMRVTWTIEHVTDVDAKSDAPAELLVQIRHVFDPAWPVPDHLVHTVVGEYFVNCVARRTLWHIAGIAEPRPAHHPESA